MTIAQDSGSIVMEIVHETPEEQTASRARSEQFDRNLNWFSAHAEELGSRFRGKCICIAGQEVFAADTASAVLAAAKAAHPDDQGRFVHYIPREKVARIYAN